MMRIPPLKSVLFNSTLSRTIAAVIGGYILANLFGIALIYTLTGSSQSGTLPGLLASFPVYAAAIMWAFGTRSVLSAWTGLLTACLICSVPIFLLMPENVF